jgi:hypothetical protein
MHASLLRVAGLRTLPACVGYRHARVARSMFCTGGGGDGLLNLVQWSLKKGIRFSKVRPEKQADARGMYATYDIAPGEVLVSVPVAAAVRTQPGDKPPSPGIPTELWQSLPWFVKLALKLENERATPASDAATYIQSLPAVVDLPLLWHSEEVQELHYPYLQSQVGTVCRLITPQLQTIRIHRRCCSWPACPPALMAQLGTRV